jgi:DNA invertase Pin-like site-specific DNA recombinase
MEGELTEVTYYSKKIQGIMDREFGKIGRFVLEKQCNDLGIEPNLIDAEDVPRLARRLSEVVSKFDEVRAKRVLIEIMNLVVKDTEEEGEEDEREENESEIAKVELEETGSSDVSLKDISERLVARKGQSQT